MGAFDDNGRMYIWTDDIPTSAVYLTYKMRICPCNMPTYLVPKSNQFKVVSL